MLISLKSAEVPGCETWLQRSSFAAASQCLAPELDRTVGVKDRLLYIDELPAKMHGCICCTYGADQRRNDSPRVEGCCAAAVGAYAGRRLPAGEEEWKLVAVAA